MKLVVNISRVLVGCLFIFSGLVKAIDPLGLSYKMQEFFEAWKNSGHLPGLMDSLNDYALSFAIIMITLEVAVGVALLLGLRVKITGWILLLLMLFFTFLTSYVLFSGKIPACGCFGDCIPLTPAQTFTKDIILLVLVLVVLIGHRYIKPLFTEGARWIILLLSIIGVVFLQWYVQKHLPLVDCLPFKKGNDILELRKMPKNAVPEKTVMVLIYEKNGEKKEFDKTNYPKGDSTWTFIDSKPVVVEKGRNNKPLINDFILTTPAGTDSTEALLSQPGEYYLVMIKNAGAVPASWKTKFDEFCKRVMPAKPVYIISSDKTSTLKLTGPTTLPIFSCDATALKTAARTDITIYLMKGPVVQNKWSGVDIGKVK